MSIENKLYSSQWNRRKESLLITLLGWVPLSLGLALRNHLYGNILRRIGTSVLIQPGVEFIRACCIEIGDQTKIFRGTLLQSYDQDSQISIEDRVSIGQNVYLYAGGKNSTIFLRNKVRLDRGVDIKVLDDGCIDLGENTYVGPYSCLSGQKIKIGKDCLIASHVSIYASNHNFEETTRPIISQGYNCKGITIEDDCWLGSKVTVVDGVTIGTGSVIGAGAVVTKDIPPYSVAVGVPAKVVSRRNEIPVNSEKVGVQAINRLP
ncbi:acyltransferase [Coleofasciculus sp. FACHB-1120]|uniref:acyltransferase n=1 Tax=Coleofasciculus sp. FACHB-1120 TaxID=2692783 RepID=UPI0016887732|nr:acyltransferase [Coleofasciculus sp. FACHB-1120]MBD2743572.1 acyltransferase [Coleofasciculus sp. FACHB-1120]